MKTFTHILASINWVDVAMLVLLIRVIFIGVKTGFVTELFKLLGIFCAIFIGLHYYTPLAVFLTKKVGWSLDIWSFVFFVLLVGLSVFAIKLLREGFFTIFKFETTHEGVNQWGSGVLSVIRALFLASLIMFGMLLSNLEWLQKQTLTSVSHKLVLKAAPDTYTWLFNNFIGKVFPQEKINEEVKAVVSRSSISRN